MSPLTGFDKFLREKLKNPEFRKAFEEAERETKALREKAKKSAKRKKGGRR